MLNTCIFVGKLYEVKKVVESDSNKYLDIVIRVEDVGNNCKNDDIECDNKRYHFIPCRVYGDNMIDSCLNYIKIEDKVGIKGRLVNAVIFDDEENKIKCENIISVEKITFLSSNKEVKK